MSNGDGKRNLPPGKGEANDPANLNPFYFSVIGGEITPYLIAGVTNSIVLAPIGERDRPPERRGQFRLTSFMGGVYIPIFGNFHENIRDCGRQESSGGTTQVTSGFFPKPFLF